MRRRAEGFSLIEVVVALAIMAIMAGAALPLMVKALNQQRQQTTRDSMKVAFEAMFGARDRRVQNMRADYGFNPGALTDLRAMMVAPAGLRTWSADTNFSWGWNGPYWNGSVATVGAVNVPADAWGNAYQLENVGAPPTWRLVSGGQDGLIATTADNLYYPSQPILVSAFDSTVSVTVYNYRVPTVPLPTTTVTVGMQDRNSGTILRSSPTPAALGAYTFTLVTSTQVPTAAVTVRPGPVTITLNVTNGTTFTATEVVDLLPGQSYFRTFEVR